MGNLGPSNQQSLLKGNQTVIPPGTPPARADSIRKALWQQFKNKNGNSWRIRRSKKTGLPVSMFGGLTEKAYRGNAKQAARAFLADHSALLGFGSLKNIKYVTTTSYRGIRYVRFNQMVKGVPVYEMQYVIHLTQNGKVNMVNGNYYPHIQVSTTPSLSSSQAASTAQADLKNSRLKDIQSRSKLVIYRGNKQFHLAWKIVMSSEKPVLTLMYMVDAHSGNIIYRLNLLADAFGRTKKESLRNISGISHKKLANRLLVAGNGSVYPTYPLSSSATTKPLYRLNGSGYLVGLYASIVNDEASRAYSVAESFQYNPSNTHFDEVNLYYHIDKFRVNFVNNYIPNIGFTQVTAHAHSTFCYINQLGNLVCTDANAAFNPSDQELYFGDASNHSLVQDLAKSDQVIYHEYSHKIIYNFNPNIESDYNQEGAISEGTPDYLAGSFTTRHLSGDYIYPQSDNQHRWRNMVNPQPISSYAEYENIASNNNGEVEAHKGGEFFSAILWDIRNSPVGATKTNILVFKTIHGLDSNPTFLEFRDGMIAADQETYNGIHVETIQNTFASWGVGYPVLPPPSSLDVTISGPDRLYSAQNGTWTASVHGAGGSISYQWYMHELSMCHACFAPFFSLNPDDTFSQSFHNSTSHSKIAGVKIVVTSAGETASAVQWITIYGQDCGDGPPFPTPSSFTSSSDSITVNIIAPEPCPEN